MNPNKNASAAIAMSRVRIGRTSMALVALAATLPAASVIPDQYEIRMIPLAPNGTYSRAAAVNNQGNATGTVNVPDPNGVVTAGFQRGYFYNFATNQLTLIQPDASGDGGGGKALRSYAADINDSNQIAGYRDRYYSPFGVNYDRGYRWNAPNGTILNVSNFAASLVNESRALAINENGVIAGYADGQINGYQALRWTQAGCTQNLGSLVAGNETFGQAINNTNVVTGYGLNATPTEAVFRYDANGPLENLGVFPFSAGSIAYDINDAGTIVGQYEVDFNTFHAFRRTSGGTWTFLPLLSGAGSTSDDSNVAHGINSLGEIVGSSEIGNANHRAWVTDGLTGMIDLNTRLVGGAGWVLNEARDISDTGYIVGNGKLNGQDRGFLLIPVSVVSGNVNLQDWLPGEQGQFVRVEIRDAVNNTLLDFENVQLGVGGSFSMRTEVRDLARVSVKASHWLAKRTAILNLSTNKTGLNFSLRNGDVDGDNAVTVFDYADLSEAFDTVFGQAKYNPGADLDGDKAVTVFDYAILSNNFDEVGD